MTWKIKIKGEKYIAEALSDDLGDAIHKAEHWRSQGAEVWIEDVNGNRVTEPVPNMTDGEIH